MRKTTIAYIAVAVVALAIGLRIAIHKPSHGPLVNPKNDYYLFQSENWSEPVGAGYLTNVVLFIDVPERRTNRPPFTVLQIVTTDSEGNRTVHLLNRWSVQHHSPTK